MPAVLSEYYAQSLKAGVNERQFVDDAVALVSRYFGHYSAFRPEFVMDILKLRKKYGYTQEKLSELTNIDYKYIQRIEGTNPPAIKIDTIERLAKALKV